MLEGATQFTISADGKKLLVLMGRIMSVIDAAPAQKPAPVSTSGMTALINPREEWKQVFTDAWRLERDFFYDPNMHGVDWPAVREQYEKLQTNESLLEFHRKSNSDSFTQQELDEARAVLDQCFADLEMELGEREWLAGNSFSLADIAWVPLFFTMDVLAGYSFAGLDNVAAWAKRIEARPSYKTAILDWWPEQMTPLNQQTA